MQKNEIIHSIRETARQVMPSGSRVILFGSQARGDAHHESDWDILILLDKSRIYTTVRSRLSYFADSLTRMFGKSELPPKEEKE